MKSTNIYKCTLLSYTSSTCSHFSLFSAFSTSFETSRWRASYVDVFPVIHLSAPTAFYQLFTICYIAIFIKHLKDLLLNLYIIINMWRNKMKCDSWWRQTCERNFAKQGWKTRSICYWLAKNSRGRTGLLPPLSFFCNFLPPGFFSFLILLQIWVWDQSQNFNHFLHSMWSVKSQKKLKEVCQ